MSCEGAVGGVGARLLGAEKTVWNVGIGDTVVLRQQWTWKEEMELSIYNSAEEGRKVKEMLWSWIKSTSDERGTDDVREK